MCRLSFPKTFLGKIIRMDDGAEFRIFRHIRLLPPPALKTSAIFIVCFKFKKFGYRTNRLLSWIPVPLIAGCPGFKEKLWMADDDSGFWQGLYLWESTGAIESYKRSFALRMMNRRAVPDSISYKTVNNADFDDFINSKIIG